jgi:hypothetical protein
LVTRQRVQVGRNHARKVVTATVDEHTIAVHHGPHLLVTALRTTSDEVRHRRAEHHWGGPAGPHGRARRHPSASAPAGAADFELQQREGAAMCAWPYRIWTLSPGARQ